MDTEEVDKERSGKLFETIFFYSALTVQAQDSPLSRAVSSTATPATRRISALSIFKPARNQQFRTGVRNWRTNDMETTI